MNIKDVAVGSIYTMLSRLVILLCGFAVTIALARTLGPVMFGIYSLILSILVWVEHSVSMGIPSVYRKIISEDKNNTAAIAASIKGVTVPYCLAVTTAFAVVSPLVAWGMDDEELILLLCIASLDIPAFGLYSTYMAILNGRGRFLSQSLLAIFYSVSRTVLIVAAVLLGFGVEGALVGNALGSLCGFFLALRMTKKMMREDVDEAGPPPGKVDLQLTERLRSFGIPYLLNFLIGSILIHMDIWLVKAFMEDREAVNAAVGFYAVAYNLARIPFFIIGGISFTVFPAVALAAFENRRSDARDQILNSLRMTLLILLPMIAVVLSTGDRMIVFLFSDAYVPSIEAFKFLFIGIAMFSVFRLFVTIIAAEDRQMASLALSMVLVPVAVILHFFLIRTHGIVGAAATTTLVSSVGLFVTGTYVWVRFGKIIELKSLVKLGSASVALYALSQWDALYQYNLIVVYLLLSIFYGVLLLVLREIEVHTVKDMTRSLLGRNAVEQGSES